MHPAHLFILDQIKMIHDFQWWYWHRAYECQTIILLFRKMHHIPSPPLLCTTCMGTTHWSISVVIDMFSVCGGMSISQRSCGSSDLCFDATVPKKDSVSTIFCTGPYVYLYYGVVRSVSGIHKTNHPKSWKIVQSATNPIFRRRKIAYHTHIPLVHINPDMFWPLNKSCPFLNVTMLQYHWRHKNTCAISPSYLIGSKHPGTFILVLYLCECVCVCVVIYLRVCHLFLSCHVIYLQMCKNSGLFYGTKTLSWLHSRGQHNGIVDVHTFCRSGRRVERCLRIW